MSNKISRREWLKRGAMGALGLALFPAEVVSDSEPAEEQRKTLKRVAGSDEQQTYRLSDGNVESGMRVYQLKRPPGFVNDTVSPFAGFRTGQLVGTVTAVADDGLTIEVQYD